MSETTTTEALTTPQGAALLTAMRELHAVESAAANAIHSESGWRAGQFGMLAEACSVASDAVFNVLNTASARLSDPVAAAAIKQWLNR